MVSAILVLALAAITLVLAWSLLSHKSPAGNLHDQHNQQKIDAQMLRCLLEQNEFHYLHVSLSRKDFQSQVRKRIRLTLEMLQLVEDNTIFLLGMENVVISNASLELTRQHNELLAGLVQLRLNLQLARVLLYLQWLFPSSTLLLPRWVQPYRNLLHSLEQYGSHPPA